MFIFFRRLPVILFPCVSVPLIVYYYRVGMNVHLQLVKVQTYIRRERNICSEEPIIEMC